MRVRTNIATVVPLGVLGSEVRNSPLRQFHARGALEEAEGHLLQARRNLAALLAIPPDRAGALEVRGSLDDRSPPPPGVEELLGLALASRPDLAAERLGIAYARAAVQAARAERFDDAVTFFTPYEAQDYRPQGKRVAAGWGGGAGTTLPILDRNQGAIARARIDVGQARVEREGVERRVANQVQQARTEYEASRETVRRWEQEALPASRGLRDEALRRWAAGGEEFDAVLDAQKTYAEAVEGCLAARVRHRRSMLKLNTAVGQRVLP
jgi:cobalt-zinc-cadmium efflux system outer membrane protein